MNIREGTSSPLRYFCDFKTSGVAQLVYWVYSCYLLPVLVQPLEAPIKTRVPLRNNMLVSNIFYAHIIHLEVCSSKAKQNNVFLHDSLRFAARNTK